MITAQFVTWLGSQSVADLEAGISSLGDCDLTTVLRNEVSRRKKSEWRICPQMTRLPSESIKSSPSSL